MRFVLYVVLLVLGFFALQHAGKANRLPPLIPTPAAFDQAKHRETESSKPGHRLNWPRHRGTLSQASLFLGILFTAIGAVVVLQAAGASLDAPTLLGVALAAAGLLVLALATLVPQPLASRRV